MIIDQQPFQKDIFKLCTSVNFSLLHSHDATHLGFFFCLPPHFYQSRLIPLFFYFAFAFVVFLTNQTNFDFIIIYIETCICTRRSGVVTTSLIFFLLKIQEEECLFFILDHLSSLSKQISKINVFYDSNNIEFEHALLVDHHCICYDTPSTILLYNWLNLLIIGSMWLIVFLNQIFDFH